MEERGERSILDKNDVRATEKARQIGAVADERGGMVKTLQPKGKGMMGAALGAALGAGTG